MQTITIEQWKANPAYQPQREQYYGVTLACGHSVAEPSIVWADCGLPSSTGYAVDPQGNKICYDCAHKQEISSALKQGKAMFYLSQRPDAKGLPKPVITTWAGRVVSDVVRVGRQWRDNFGGSRISFRFILDNTVWCGSGPGYGMYCRVKRTKLRHLAT